MGWVGGGGGGDIVTVGNSCIPMTTQVPAGPPALSVAGSITEKTCTHKQ